MQAAGLALSTFPCPWCDAPPRYPLRTVRSGYEGAQVVAAAEAPPDGANASNGLAGLLKQLPPVTPASGAVAGAATPSGRLSHPTEAKGSTGGRPAALTGQQPWGGAAVAAAVPTTMSSNSIPDTTAAVGVPSGDPPAAFPSRSRQPTYDPAVMDMLSGMVRHAFACAMQQRQLYVVSAAHPAAARKCALLHHPCKCHICRVHACFAAACGRMSTAQRPWRRVVAVLLSSATSSSSFDPFQDVHCSVQRWCAGRMA